MMADAFSLKDKDVFVSAEEIEVGEITLTIETAGGPTEITVEAGDLARALLTASPSFATGVGEIAQRAILNYLGHDENP